MPDHPRYTDAQIDAAIAEFRDGGPVIDIELVDYFTPAQFRRYQLAPNVRNSTSFAVGIVNGPPVKSQNRHQRAPGHLSQSSRIGCLRRTCVTWDALMYDHHQRPQRPGDAPAVSVPDRRPCAPAESPPWPSGPGAHEFPQGSPVMRDPVREVPQ